MLSVTRFFSILMLSFFISCGQSDTNTKTNSPDNLVLQNSYSSFIEENIKFNSSRDSLTFFMSYLKEKKLKKAIFLVFRKEDCSTCISNELGMIAKTFHTNLRDVHLVADSVAVHNIQREWATLSGKLNVVYNNGTLPDSKKSPYYVFIDLEAPQVFKYFVEYQFPSFSELFLDQIN